MTRLAEKWNETGLLDNIENDRKKTELAEELERCYKIVKKANSEKIVNGTALPAVSRIYRKAGTVDGERVFFEIAGNIEEYLESVRGEFEDVSEADIEAEATERFARDYIEEYHNES